MPSRLRSVFYALLVVFPWLDLLLGVPLSFSPLFGFNSNCNSAGRNLVPASLLPVWQSPSVGFPTPADGQVHRRPEEFDPPAAKREVPQLADTSLSKLASQKTEGGASGQFAIQTSIGPWFAAPELR